MFFDNYNQHKDAKVRPSLLWEYDMEGFDWQEMRTVVVQRVIERGRMDDFYAILNMYGLEGVKIAIKEIPYLNPKDKAFVCNIFEIKKEELKCYIKKQFSHQHWNS
ncbi:hypothetical protein [Bacteroides sp. 519]|uniref:DUF6922 domain-containing protein n=1 Tax=Bacteroides sp. 519 TaxID=2302937 RepID=UPI0013D5B539|nr:hypothetical protein [Bacteroides sp. 519]NDV59596.1 hypothetical protein [Bacteroides sp. 519]